MTETWRLDSLAAYLELDVLLSDLSLEVRCDARRLGSHTRGGVCVFAALEQVLARLRELRRMPIGCALKAHDSRVDGAFELALALQLWRRRGRGTGRRGASERLREQNRN